MKQLIKLFGIAMIAVVIIFAACSDGGGSTPPPGTPHGGLNAGDLFTSTSGIQMSWIPSVEGFSVGSGTVKLTGFYMGRYEVTQQQWETVMTGSSNVVKPSSFSSSPEGSEIQGKRPVERVTWFDAIEFCNRLSEKEGLTPYYSITSITRSGESTGYITAANVTTTSGNGYRLPTEAQWQYAAQAGSDAEATITEATGWYTTNSSSKTHQVGIKTANAWNLYDMLGNVWEWCYDWYDASYPSSAVDPAGASSGSYRVLRGGSWLNTAGYCRSACRSYFHPGGGDRDLGFRVARP